MDGRFDYDGSTIGHGNKSFREPTSSLYEEFSGYWYSHVYVLSFGFFCVAFGSFFSALSIRSRYSQLSLMFIASILQIASGCFRSGFLMLDPYGSRDRLPSSLVTFLYALTFPCITATTAMTIFSIAKHCLRTEPKSFVWFIIFFHFAVSIIAEITAVNDDSLKLLLQAVTAIFMLWPMGLLLLFCTIRSNIINIDKPASVSRGDSTREPEKKDNIANKRAPSRRLQKRRADAAAQTSFIRRPQKNVEKKSKSCGTINEPSAGSQMTIPTSSVVSLASLESWSPQDSPLRNDSPGLIRPVSMPSIMSPNALKRFRFNFKLFSTPSLRNLSASRKLKRTPGRTLTNSRRPSDPRNGSSFEREIISGAESDLTGHKDTDSNVINYFTSEKPPERLSSDEVKKQLAPPSDPKNATNQKAPNPPKSLISDALWGFIRRYYILMIVYLTYCGLYLFSVFKHPVDMRTQTRTTVWDWFTFQSVLRIFELIVCINLANIIDHANILESCNLVRQRDLLRV